MSKNVILGINGIRSRDHDAAACLIVDGEIVAAAEQERFSRKKKAFDEYPADAVTFCLESSGVKASDIDVITVGWKKPVAGREMLLPLRHITNAIEIPIKQHGHHESHAASTFYTSGFEESAILVVDGEGEGESSSIWLGSQNGLSKVESISVNKSLGYFYSAISKFCGLGTFGAGKVMGLAPYGEPKYVDTLRDIHGSIELNNSGSKDSQDEFIAQVIAKLEAAGIARAQEIYEFDHLSQRTKRVPILMDDHRHLAASVQKYLEQEIIELARKARDITASVNLCMAGGVAMNCVANSVLENSGIFERFHLQPACEDNGIAMGSALAELGQYAELKTPYLGPSFTDQDIAAILSSRGIHSYISNDISAETAQIIAEGNIVGWFQGGLEYGPRALGNRSILANPSISGMHTKVSVAKRRELWRPFGPSVLEESGSDLFRNFVPTPYMLRSFTVRPEWRERLAAVVHVDGSTRPQTVTETANPRYYRLIKKFAELTAIPAVLNTSFNDDREPIVCTPDDALKTFATTGLDVLVLGNRIIRKSDGEINSKPRT